MAVLPFDQYALMRRIANRALLVFVDWRTNRIFFGAGVCVAVGFFLTAVDRSLLALGAAGAFGDDDAVSIGVAGRRIGGRRHGDAGAFGANDFAVFEAAAGVAVTVETGKNGVVLAVVVAAGARRDTGAIGADHFAIGVTIASVAAVAACKGCPGGESLTVVDAKRAERW